MFNLNFDLNNKSTKIYLVENCYGDSNKVYIGKTKNNRTYDHRYKFGTNIKYNYIDLVLSLNRKEWGPVESYWIEQFRQWGFEIMNKNKGGGGLESHSDFTKLLISKKIKGRIESLETKLKKRKQHSPESGGRIRASKIGKPLPEGTGGKISLKVSKPIHQYDLNGNFIQEFTSQTLAGKHLSKNTGAISECCKGKRKSAYKYIWKFKN